MPRVSVVIPTHNRADFLRFAIRSVLKQTFQDFEIIVVDDASRDNTAEVVAGFADARITYLRHAENQQVAEARNTGIRHAKGEFVAFLDDDDEWMSEKITKQVAAMDQSRPGTGAIYTGFSRVDIETGEVLDAVYPVLNGRVKELLRSKNVIGTASTVMVRRQCFDRVGIFDPTITFGEEYDMWIRISTTYDFVGIAEPLVRYSVHSASLSRNQLIKISGLKRQLEKHAVLFSQDQINFSRRYRSLGVLYLDAHDAKNARSACWTALRLYPLSLRNHLYWFVCCLQAASNERRSVEPEEREGTSYGRRVLRAVGSRVPWLRDSYRRVSNEYRMMRYAWRSGLWGILRRRKATIRRRQVPLAWEGLLTLQRGEALSDALARRRLAYREGGHAVYVPPQEGLAEKLGAFVSLYPKNAGFKILKNLKGPREARYLGDLRINTWTQSTIVGTAQDLVTAANYLTEIGIGPRLYDVAEVSAGAATFTVFVIEHISGAEPTDPECRGFLRFIHSLVDERQITIASPDWQKQADFRCPDCSGNLLRSRRDNSLKYVDFQNFVVRNIDERISRLLADAKSDVHFGNESLLRGGRYLYQQVPGVRATGRRDTGLRWQRINELLSEAGVAVAGRLVLDVGCNMGMMLAEALSHGALWGVGWDRPAVTQHGAKLLSALGYTRYTLQGAELTKEYPLCEDIPVHLTGELKGAVVLYLAIRHHVGFLDSLGTIPWKALVYEGAQEEHGRDFDKITRDLKKVVSCELVAHRQVADGDSDARPLALFLRSPQD